MSRNRQRTRTRPPRKKSKSTLWIFILVAAIVLIATIFALSPDKKSQRKQKSRKTAVHKKTKQTKNKTKQNKTKQNKTKQTEKKQLQVEEIDHDGKPRLYSSAKLTSKSSKRDPIRSIKKQRNFSAVKKIILVDGSTKKETSLEKLSLVAKHALWVFIQNYSVGTEWDFILTFKDNTRYRTSVLLEPNGTLLVHEGVRHHAQKPSLSRDQIQKKYQLGPLVGRSSSWSADNYAVLETALETLSEKEIAVIKDMPIVRERDQMGKHDNKTGLYIYNNSYAEILLFDKLYKHLEQGYSGTPNKPYNLGDVTLIHEIGHAIANYPFLNWVTLQKNTRTAYNKKVSDINAFGRKIPVSQSSKYKQEKDRLEEIRVVLDQSKQKTREYSSQSPVIASFLEVRSFTEGPTEYSNTSPDEAFAEAFSMFRLDPQALERIDPKLYQWFATDTHIQVMLDALPEEPPVLRYNKE